MKITKLAHACLLLEDKSGQRLMIDPGSFTKLPKDFDGITVLVVTEEHYDHYNLENIQEIAAQNPEVKIFTTQKVHEQLAEASLSSTAVSGSYSETVGAFTVSFTEVDHAPVYLQSPCKSLAVQVNDFLYYPSDSYHVTTNPIEILALPTSGPWHKLSEAIEFAKQITATKIIATHNGLYNENGNTVANNFLRNNTTTTTREYLYPKEGESFEP